MALDRVDLDAEFTVTFTGRQALIAAYGLTVLGATINANIAIKSGEASLVEGAVMLEHATRLNSQMETPEYERLVAGVYSTLMTAVGVDHPKFPGQED